MKTFLLCVGSERCGTSWLYSFIKQLEGVNLGDLKEYHFFDSINIPEFKYYADMNKKHDIFYKFYENDKNYFDYFKNILENSLLTGDFSPGYSALSENVLLNIKETFNKINIDVKTILLLRDPVDRHISATNMRIKREHIKLNNQEYNELLLKNIEDKVFQIHSSYTQSHNNFTKIFQDNHKTIKYENLFQESTIRNLCEFLNLSSAMPNFNIKINYSEYNNNIDDYTIKKLKDHYTEQINFFYSNQIN